jgi:hypothetical protein
MRPIGRAPHPSYGSSFAEPRSTAAMKLARASAKQSPRRLKHVTPQEEGRERESADNIVRRRRIGTRVGKKRRTDFLEGDTRPWRPHALSIHNPSPCESIVRVV